MAKHTEMEESENEEQELGENEEESEELEEDESAAKAAADKAPSRRELREAERLEDFYTSYSWVVPGSVREPTDEDRAVLDHIHGKVCDILCIDTGEKRTINVQDAFQVKRTVAAQKRHMRAKRAEKSKSKRAEAREAAPKTATITKPAPVSTDQAARVKQAVIASHVAKSTAAHGQRPR